ncbi:hypothetical protein FB446DRAFT_784351 [Lentinula raphanica]|nr:hypothetical protein FB446DRAFT_784351 [Lentinula raphanica]
MSLRFFFEKSPKIFSLGALGLHFSLKGPVCISFQSIPPTQQESPPFIVKISPPQKAPVRCRRVTTSFIQQPYSVTPDPACISTFDHGLGRTVYVHPPVDRFGQRVPLRQVWLLRRVGGIKWEYYCPCPPPENRPGIPARCYEVHKTSSPYFGNVYLGCGKTRQRCDWRVRLDLVYLAQDQQGHPQQFPDTDDLDGDHASAAPLAAEQSGSQDNEAEIQRRSSAPIDANDSDFEDKKFDDAFAQLMQQLQISGQLTAFPQYSEHELAEWLGELRLNGLEEDEEEWQLPAHLYEEMLAAFAGQDDVLVTPDGVIHYIPKDPEATVAENSTSDVADGDGLGWGDNETTLIEMTDPSTDLADAVDNQKVSPKILLDEPAFSAEKASTRTFNAN